MSRRRPGFLGATRDCTTRVRPVRHGRGVHHVTQTQLGSGLWMRNHISRFQPHRPHARRATRSISPPMVWAACSSSRFGPSQWRHAVASAWGSTCDADSSSSGLSGVPPGSSRASRSRSRASFSSARARVRRSVLGEAFFFATSPSYAFPNGGRRQRSEPIGHRDVEDLHGRRVLPVGTGRLRGTDVRLQLAVGHRDRKIVDEGIREPEGEPARDPLV